MVTERVSMMVLPGTGGEPFVTSTNDWRSRDDRPKPTRVDRAAMLWGDCCWIAERPGRHHHLIQHIARLYPDLVPIDGEQGFVLDNGQFVRREPALAFALRVGQLREEDAHPTGMLFSEDLW